MHSLFNIIQASLPATSADWEAVTAAYNTAENPTEKHRDAMSLKRKFRSMCLASKHTRTDLARATRCAFRTRLTSAESLIGAARSSPHQARNLRLGALHRHKLSLHRR
ncbi:hypothetical protein PHYSODRAFT_355845 [Phytophthora sojae]|uniref:DUF6818 domain-containing protein n=1 Tax=Phytophthora sojae (strain P6497) TaxID=1094619 RepID=G5A3H5_PHYSP|nr:hypothetical protein PHYSODRAFT_355845 [Phytophthora sojae]EGZ10191.1 hypothetical protein PHYSODRAFT_355845 [Phytophthora sojae]|eukprot:XP_009535052.1 hypothetical protein PHYSODRAFT_355845 [Phytophthora sojae]